MDHLPKELHGLVGRKLDRAWAETNPERALRSLENVARSLEDPHPGYSTYTIESIISVGRTVTRNVKRWRGGKMIERWTAAGMEVAARQFRR